MKLENFTQQASFGIIWMLGSGLCFVTVIGLVRSLEGSLPAAEASFIRYVIGLVFFLPYLYKFAGRLFQKSNLLRYFIRSGFHSLGVVTWFYAMSKLPVAEVTAIGYMTPVFVTLGGVIVFKEKISVWRSSAIILAFFGVLIILRPGFHDLSFGHGSQIFATMFFAGSYLMVKDLTRTETATAIVAMMTLFVTITLAPMALAVWVSPSINEIIVLAFVALFATAGHFFMTKALSLAPLGFVQPVEFLKLVWATLLGVLIFGESIDPFVLSGGVLIIVSVTVIAYRESLILKKN